MLKRMLMMLPMPLMETNGGGSGGAGGTGGQAGSGTQAGAGTGTAAGSNGSASAGNFGGQGSTTSGQIDYEKIASIVAGKQQVAEETVLKNYFKQQGLSQEEAAQQAQIEKEATLAALTLGVDLKTVPYVLKLANLSQSIGQDGKINAESMQGALKKVLEDVPALKTTSTQPSLGFQIGAPGGNNQQTATDDALKAAFGL